jgi:hypothetical protein
MFSHRPGCICCKTTSILVAENNIKNSGRTRQWQLISSHSFEASVRRRRTKSDLTAVDENHLQVHVHIEPGALLWLWVGFHTCKVSLQMAAWASSQLGGWGPTAFWVFQQRSQSHYITYSVVASPVRFKEREPKLYFLVRWMSKSLCKKNMWSEGYCCVHFWKVCAMG